MAAFDTLRHSIRGAVTEAHDVGYDALRQTFNALVERRPKVIVEPTDAADVAAALAVARAEGLPVSIRGGGHSVAGHSFGDNALAIDLRRIRSVEIDPAARVVRAGGGATWRDVDPVCQEHGLALPGGTFDTTGIAGLTLGGGIGHLLGAYGLTLDSLRSAEVVTADGEIITASDSEHPDLFWALRGGGGNFGVVTQFEYRLHPVSTIGGGVIVYALADAAAALRLFRDITASAPDELTLIADLGQPGLTLYVCYVGDLSHSERVLEPLRRTVPVLDDRLGLIPYLDLQRITGETPPGLRHYWKGHFVRELSDELIDLTVAHYARRSPTPRRSILIEPMHGVAARVPVESTAFNQRSARYNVSALAIWDDTGVDDEQIEWARSYAEMLELWTASGGGYVNYGSHDEAPSRVEAAFGPEKFARLREVKQRYDPENSFRFNPNVPPAGP